MAHAVIPEEDVWSAQNTTPGAIEAALRDLLACRHRQSEGTIAPARVLNLVVIVDARFRGEVENRLERVGRFHPSRTVLCAVEPGRTALDAWVSMATADLQPGPGRLAISRERVEILMGRRHQRGLETIVGPLLIGDVATLLWAPHGHHEAIESLRRVGQVVLVDSITEPVAAAALARADALLDDLYVVDLAWLRSTPWRERVAAAFDPPEHRGSLGSLSAVCVRHRHDSLAVAALFAGWLASRLGWRPEALMHRGDDLVGRARARRGDVEVTLRPVQQPGAPGLAGVTLDVASGESVALDRAPGGLCEARTARDGTRRQWTVLGASRGEAGILGEGVRQALLRDATYRPALAAARVMVSG